MLSGIVISLIFVYANASSGIVANDELSSNITTDRLLSAKTPLPILSTEEGIVILLKFFVLAKALCSITFKLLLDLNDTFLIAEAANASLPINRTDAGIVTDSNLLPLNAYLSILIKVSGKVISSISLK